MSFQAYIDNIQAKTGNTPEDFKRLAEESGVLKENIKATEFIDWLAKDFDLGRGHSMALWGLFINNGWVQTSHTTMKKKNTLRD